MGMKRLAIRTGLLAAALAAWATPGAAQGHSHSHGAARADTVIRQWTPADAHFMTAMIGHHAQAVQMSRLAPTHGASPAVRRLADRIINAQQDEIATMQRWLRARGQPVPEVGAKMEGMDHGAHHMPGMLTEAQMQQLDRARGAEFDQLFLQLMIQHHRGAVAMVSQLFGTYGAGQDETVFKFASDVNVDQVTEIARMENMLVDLVFGEGSR